MTAVLPRAGDQMDLVGLARNPIPSSAVSGRIKGHGGVELRFARWEATRGPRRGTICLFGGRGEFIEKYFETVADLRRRGFAVATMDWRGQGGSARLTANPRKCHVRSFADHDQDLVRFMKDVVLPDCPPPYIALAHSMGGNILLRNAAVTGSWFERMVLVAPMIAIAPEKLGFPVKLARIYAEVLPLLGLGRAFVYGGRDQPEEMRPFEETELTSDRERYMRNRGVLEAAPALAVGSPTVSWLRSALRSMAEIASPRFPAQVKVPLLMIGAGHDHIVSTTAIEALSPRLKLGSHVLIRRARHEIMQESDDIRQQFWAAVDAYLGVSGEV